MTSSRRHTPPTDIDIDIALVGLACRWGAVNDIDAFVAALRHGRQVAGTLPRSVAPLATPSALVTDTAITDTAIDVAASACASAGIAPGAPIAIIFVHDGDPQWLDWPQDVPLTDLGSAILQRAGLTASDRPAGSVPVPDASSPVVVSVTISTSVAEALADAIGWMRTRRVTYVVLAAASLLRDPHAAAETHRPFSIAFDVAAAAPPPSDGAAAIVLAAGAASAAASHQPVYARLSGWGMHRQTRGAGHAGEPRYRAVHGGAGRPLADVTLVAVAGTSRERTIEARTVARLFGRARAALACVRATVGDAGPAADLGTVIATALCLHYRMIPAVPCWTAPRPACLHDHPTLHVAADTHHWPPASRIAALTLRDSRRRAVPLALEEDDSCAPPGKTFFIDGCPMLMPVCGVTLAELRTRLVNLRTRVTRGESLRSLSIGTLQEAVRQPDRPLRLALVAQTPSQIERDLSFLLDAVERAVSTDLTLRTPHGSCFTGSPLGPDGRVAFVYSGVGSAYHGLARELALAVPGFLTPRLSGYASNRSVEAEWTRTFQPQRMTCPDAAWRQHMDEWLNTNLPALTGFSISHSVLHTRLLTELLGVRAHMAFGYSVGELSMRVALGQWRNPSDVPERCAAVYQALAGDMPAVRAHWRMPATDPDDADRAAGPLWQLHLVTAPAAAVESACARERHVYVMAIHTRTEVLIGGHPLACQRVIATVKATAILLPFAVATHAPPATEVREVLYALGDHAVTEVRGIELYSAATYAPIPQDRATIAQSTADLLQRRLDVPRLVQRVYEDGARVFIEVGARNNCSNWIDVILDGRPHVATPLDIKGVPSDAAWLRSLALLFAHHVDLDLRGLLAGIPSDANGTLPRHSQAHRPHESPMPVDEYSLPQTPPGQHVDPIASLLRRELASVLDIEATLLEDGQSLRQLGIDSLRALDMKMRIERRWHVTLPIESLVVRDSIREIADLIVEVVEHGQAPEPPSGAVTTRAAIDADLCLQDGTCPRRARPGGMSLVADPRRILLTGATGLVGAFLLRDLLTHTAATIHCLVRATSTADGLRRIRANLQRHGLWSRDLEARIEIEVGDLGQPWLGLSPSRYAALADTVDVVHHNGALVQLLWSYEAMRAANVMGTRTLLHFASYARAKPLCLISTVGIFDTPECADATCLLEDETPRDATLLPNGYTQSKWVAEQLARRARAEGLPVAICRVGHVVNDGMADGVSHSLLARVFQASLALGAAPEVLRPIDAVPVTYVSRAIVALASQPAPFSTTVHIVNPSPLTAAQARAWFEALNLEPLPARAWLARAAAAARIDPDHPLFPFFGLIRHADERALALLTRAIDRPILDCRRARQRLSGTALNCPSAQALIGPLIASLGRPPDER